MTDPFVVVTALRAEYAALRGVVGAAQLERCGMGPARVHEWLTPEFDAVVQEMRTTRVQLNSAALWWFFRLPPQERAHILGEYVKVQALGGRELPPDRAVITVPENHSSRKADRPRRRKTTQ